MKDYLEIATVAADMHCHQDINELAQLLEVLDKLQPKLYVEIGTYYAAGTWAVQLVLPDTEIICIDNNSLSSDVNTADYLQKYNVEATLIAGDSQEQTTVDALAEELDGRFIDFFFIDGCHDYEPARDDFENYIVYVKKDGGVIALHDIYHGPHVDGVGRFWQELKKEYKTTEISVNSSLLGVGLVWI